MLTGAGRTQAYDAGGRMKSAVKGSHTARFVHGPDGQRIKRTDVSTGTETTLYLGSVEKVTHVDGTKTVRRRIGGMALEVRRLTSTGTETSRATYYLLQGSLGQRVGGGGLGRLGRRRDCRTGSAATAPGDLRRDAAHLGGPDGRPA